MPTVAYRAIRERRRFVHAPEVKRVLGDTLDNEVKLALLRRFEAVVANWQHAPVFQARKFVTENAIWVNVFPTGENKRIYQYVTGGTRPHPIAARHAKTLAFVWGGPGSYTPKTAPGGHWGGPGTASGSMHYPLVVQHPGNKPRDFEAVIKREYQPEFLRTLENAFRRAIRRL